MTHHHIPGARKRRDHKHGPRTPTGWVRARRHLARKPSGWTPFRLQWRHPDGRWFEACFGGDWLSHDSQFYVDMTRHLGKGASHPGRFREQLPF